MGVFKKKADPISQRGRELNARIADLEAKIKQLNAQAQKEKVDSHDARFRSTAYPQGRTVSTARHSEPPPDPVFEKVDRNPLKAAAEEKDSSRSYNELGLRKYDLMSLWQRLKQQMRGPTAPNPKLV